MTSWGIDRQITDGRLFYTVRWSPWGPMDKDLVNKRVPAESGIYQLYRRDGRGLTLAGSRLCWYGGIRHSLRELMDPLAPGSDDLKPLAMERDKAFFRYVLSSSMRDLENVMAWLTGSDPRDEEIPILVDEIDCRGLYRIEPRDESNDTSEPAMSNFVISTGDTHR